MLWNNIFNFFENLLTNPHPLLKNTAIKASKVSWISVEVPPCWIISYLFSPQRMSVIFIMRMLTPALGLNPGYLLLVLVNQPWASWNSSAGSLNAISRVVSKSLLTDSARLQQCHAGAGARGAGAGQRVAVFVLFYAAGALRLRCSSEFSRAGRE